MSGYLSRALAASAVLLTWVWPCAVFASGDVLSEVQTSPPPCYMSDKPYTGQKISLDYQNADLRRVISIIGEVSGKNIVASEAVRGRVTIKLTNVPWDQALDIVLASRNLGVEESGNVLTIQDLSALIARCRYRPQLFVENQVAAGYHHFENR